MSAPKTEVIKLCIKKNVGETRIVNFLPEDFDSIEAFKDRIMKSVTHCDNPIPDEFGGVCDFHVMLKGNSINSSKLMELRRTEDHINIVLKRLEGENKIKFLEFIKGKFSSGLGYYADLDDCKTLEDISKSFLNYALMDGEASDKSRVFRRLDGVNQIYYGDARDLLKIAVTNDKIAVKELDRFKIFISNMSNRHDAAKERGEKVSVPDCNFFKAAKDRISEIERSGVVVGAAAAAPSGGAGGYVHDPVMMGQLAPRADRGASADRK